MEEELKRKLSLATEFLKKTQEYHKEIKRKHIWHLEANAQVGLVQFLADLDETIKAVE